MSQYLPYGKFKWLNQKEIDKFDVNSIQLNAISLKKIVQMDTYQKLILNILMNGMENIHELHNDYPLAPEKLEISHEMMSNYCSNVANTYDIKIGG